MHACDALGQLNPGSNQWIGPLADQQPSYKDRESMGAFTEVNYEGRDKI